MNPKETTSGRSITQIFEYEGRDVLFYIYLLHWSEYLYSCMATETLLFIKENSSSPIVIRKESRTNLSEHVTGDVSFDDAVAMSITYLFFETLYTIARHLPKEHAPKKLPVITYTMR